MRDRTLSMAESGWQTRPLPEPAVKLKGHAAHPVPCTTRRRRVASRHGAGAFLFQSRQVGEPRLGRREHRSKCARFAGLRRRPGAGARRPVGGVSPARAPSRRRTDPRIDHQNCSIAQSVRDSLASEGVLVLAREDRLEAYRRLALRPGAELTHASIIKIGESLDASQVIYGFYELLPSEPGNPQSKGSLRITARILDLKHTRQGAVYSELGALEDLGSLAVHLGWQTLEWLDPKTAPGEQEFMKARPAVRLDAVESYVRGLLSTSPEQRHRYFTQAARLDAHYSQPCFELGRIFWEKKDYKVAAGWLERVARSDPHYLEAQFFLGLCRFANGDFKGAEQSFELVAAAIPLNEVYNDLGVVDRKSVV